MDVKLEWILVLVCTAVCLLVVILIVLLEHNSKLVEIAAIKALPMSEKHRAELLAAIASRDQQFHVFTEMVEGRFRVISALVSSLSMQLRRIFYPELPSAAPESKRPESPGTSESKGETPPPPA